MKKRTIALLLAAVMLFAMIPVAAQADDEFVIENGVLTAYNGGGGSVTIPSSVTSIGDYAFSDCQAMTAITIPDTVGYIGEYAFSGCSKLRSIAIPDIIKSIKRYTFYRCENLTTVTIGENSQLEQIEEFAFEDCFKLKSIAIPSGVESIGEFAFENCNDLASVTFPEDSRLTSIGRDAFFMCTSLATISLPRSLTTIGDSAFEGAAGLTSITIPNTVTSIGNSAFMHAGSLETVTFEENSQLKSIGDSAFYGAFAGNGELSSITIPDGVTSIGSGTFAYNNYLISISIPGSVTDMGYVMFENCDNLNANSIEIATDDIDEYKTVRDLLINNAGATESQIKTATFKLQVTVDNAIAHGTVTANPTQASIGANVTLTVTPDEGYELETLTVKGTSNTVVAVTNNQFTMPEENVTVTATFKELAQVEPDANILGMNGFFADYFVLNLYVQTDVENPTFVIKRNVTGTEETLEEMTTKSDFANKNIATYTVDKLSAGQKNKIGLTNVSGKECYMVSIKFFTRYLNDDIVLSMKNGDTVMNISAVVKEGMEGEIGIGEAVPEQSYNFIDYVSIMAKKNGIDSAYGKLYSGLKLAAEGAKAIG